MKDLLSDKIMRPLLAFFFVSLILFLLVQTSLSFSKMKYVGSESFGTLRVSGSGKVKTVPDKAVFTIEIRESGKSRKEASNKGAIKSNKVMSLLKKEGVDEKSIKTTHYSLRPVYIWHKDKTREIDFYELNQTLKVELSGDLLEKAPKILASLSSLELSNIGSLNFVVSNREVFKEKARSKAIENAKEKANKLARKLGVSLISLESYEESFDGPIYPVFAKALNYDAPDEEYSVPDLPKGEEEISVKVYLVYKIK